MFSLYVFRAFPIWFLYLCFCKDHTPPNEVLVENSRQNVGHSNQAFVNVIGRYHHQTTDSSRQQQPPAYVPENDLPPSYEDVIEQDRERY